MAINLLITLMISIIIYYSIALIGLLKVGCFITALILVILSSIEDFLGRRCDVRR